jgi:hypothetical protein
LEIDVDRVFDCVLDRKNFRKFGQNDLIVKILVVYIVICANNRSKKALSVNLLRE